MPDKQGNVGGKDGWVTCSVYVPNFASKKLGGLGGEEGEAEKALQVYDNSHFCIDIIDGGDVTKEPAVPKIVGTYQASLKSLVEEMRKKAPGATNGSGPGAGPAVKSTGFQRSDTKLQSIQIFLSEPDRVKTGPGGVSAPLPGASPPPDISLTFASTPVKDSTITSDSMMPVSPSAIGAGVSSTMFTTHKGAYSKRYLRRKGGVGGGC